MTTKAVPITGDRSGKVACKKIVVILQDALQNGHLLPRIPRNKPLLSTSHSHLKSLLHIYTRQWQHRLFLMLNGLSFSMDWGDEARQHLYLPECPGFHHNRPPAKET